MTAYVSQGHEYIYHTIPKKFDLLEVCSNVDDMTTLKITEHFKYSQLGIDLKLSIGKIDDLKSFNRNNISEIIDNVTKRASHIERDFKNVYDIVCKDLPKYEKIKIFTTANYCDDFLIPYYFLYEFWNIVKDKEISVVYYKNELKEYFEKIISKASEKYPTNYPDEDKCMNNIINHKITKLLEINDNDIADEVDNIVNELLDTEIVLSGENKKRYKDLWEKEVQLNSDIRNIENGKIMDYSYDEIEQKILNRFKDKKDIMFKSSYWYELHQSDILKNKHNLIHDYLIDDMIKKGLISFKA